MRIFLAVLLFIFILLCLPIICRFSFGEGEAFLSVRWLFLNKTLLPAAEKTDEKTKPRKNKPEKPAKSGQKKNMRDVLREKPPGELLHLALDAAGKCIVPVRRFLRRTTLAKFYLRIVVVGDDAADTAIRYGKYQSVVPLSIAAIDRTVRLHAEHIDIIPGFTEEQESVSLSGQARACPLAIIALALNLLIIAAGVLKKLDKIPAKHKQENTETPSQNGKEVSENGK